MRPLPSSKELQLPQSPCRGVQSLFKLLALLYFATRFHKMEMKCFLVLAGSVRRKIASS